MAIFNREFLMEAKYSYGRNSEYDEDKEIQRKLDKNEKVGDKSKYLSKDDITKSVNTVKVMLGKYPALKKCCDYIDLIDKDQVNDDGERESELDRYYKAGAHGPLNIVNGDILDGYPDFRSGGSENYEADVQDFVNDVNSKLKQNNVPAKFKVKGDKDEEAIGFVISSTKGMVQKQED